MLSGKGHPFCFSLIVLTIHDKQQQNSKYISWDVCEFVIFLGVAGAISLISEIFWKEYIFKYSP